MTYELLQESVSDLFFEQACSCEEIVMEGATLDVNKIFRDLQKKYKEVVKDIKKEMSDKNYDAAAKKCDDLVKIIKEYETEIDNIKDSAGSIIGGYFFQSWMTWFKAVLVGIPTFGIGVVVSEVKDLVDMIQGVVKQWKDEGEVTPEMFNMRRDKIKGIIKQMETVIGNLKNEIEKMGKTEKEDDKKDVKESVSEVKLEIFESCRAGEISEEERDMLLSMI